MKYLAVSVIGGLGNQLFQIANALMQANSTGRELLIIKKKSSYSISGDRPVYWSTFFHKLNKFFIPPEEFKDFKRDKTTVVYKEPTWDYRKIQYSEPMLAADIIILEGYFQSEKYFDRSLVNRYIELPTSISSELDKIKIKEIDIMMHVRRGDYINSSLHPVQPIEYYRKGLDAIMSLHPTTTGDIWVFSDDLDWCKNNLLFNRAVHYMSAEHDYEELYLMSQFCYGIIANSSFSWWGTYLGLNDPFIVAPLRWSPYRDSFFLCDL